MATGHSRSTEARQLISAARDVPASTLCWCCALLLWSASGCQSAGDPSDVAQPALDTVICLGTTTEVDVGSFFYHWDGSQPTLTFRVRNPLSEPLTIESVRSSCGCSNAWMDEKLMPSQSEGKLHVRMNPGLTGKHKIVITLMHGGERSTSLHIDGHFFDTCRIEPTELYFPRVTEAEHSRCSVVYVHVASRSEDAPAVKCQVQAGTPVIAGPIVHRGSQQVEPYVYRHVFEVPVALAAPTTKSIEPDGQVNVVVLVGNPPESRVLGVRWARIRRHRHISIATGKYWLRTSLGVR
jgi:hypothetical protein